MKWDLQDWPYLLPNIVHTIHNRRQPRLDNKAPVQLRFGKEPENPLDQVFHHPIEGLNTKPINSGILIQHYEDLVESVAIMHKQAQEFTARKRALASAYHDVKLPKRFQKMPNFEVGEYVLVAMDEKKFMSTSKLQRRWLGPFRITKVDSAWVMFVENLVTKEINEVHIERLRFYADQHLNVDTEMLEQIAYDGCMYEVQDILDLKYENGKFYLQIRWRGLQDSDITWEPLERLYHDVPELCKQYVVNENNPLFQSWSKVLKAESEQ